MILNCFLCSSQPDYELYKEKDHCSIYFVISRYIWHSVKTKRGTREAATEQPGLMPLKAGLLCSPPPVAPHSSQSIFHTVASKACTTCSPAGPSLTWPLSLPQPFLPHSLCSSHTSHTIAPHTHGAHSRPRGFALAVPSTWNSLPPIWFTPNFLQVFASSWAPDYLIDYPWNPFVFLCLFYWYITSTS